MPHLPVDMEALHLDPLLVGMEDLLKDLPVDCLLEVTEDHLVVHRPAATVDRLVVLLPVVMADHLEADMVDKLCKLPSNPVTKWNTEMSHRLVRSTQPPSKLAPARSH